LTSRISGLRGMVHLADDRASGPRELPTHEGRRAAMPSTAVLRGDLGDVHIARRPKADDEESPLSIPAPGDADSRPLRQLVTNFRVKGGRVHGEGLEAIELDELRRCCHSANLVALHLDERRTLGYQ